MKTNYQTAVRLRALVRWSTGTIVTGGIIAGVCILFPAVLSSFTAFSMTCCLSLFVGLNIALPPINPADDWVPIREREEVQPTAATVDAVSTVPEESGKPATPAEKQPEPSPFEVLPVHLARIQGLLHLWEHSLQHRGQHKTEDKPVETLANRRRFDPEQFLREDQVHRTRSR
ncbi:MAG: hypothetical protein ACO3ZW_03450 [Opitutales bacterium]|jgi:hypothetical protein